jgi:hypothetical protein
MNQQIRTKSPSWRLGGAILASLLLALMGGRAEAWTSNEKAFRLPRNHKTGRQQPGGTTTMYMPSSTPSSQPPMFVAQKMLMNPGNPRVGDPLRQHAMMLSNSVLASCDTLPSFSTAHGLLSPETVMRLEEVITEGHRSDALNRFLDTYRRKGPLACLPMLSEPDVLPHLTAALRDIAL